MVCRGGEVAAGAAGAATRRAFLLPARRGVSAGVVAVYRRRDHVVPDGLHEAPFRLRVPLVVSPHPIPWRASVAVGERRGPSDNRSSVNSVGRHRLNADYPDKGPSVHLRPFISAIVISAIVRFGAAATRIDKRCIRCECFL